MSQNELRFFMLSLICVAGYARTLLCGVYQSSTLLAPKF